METISLVPPNSTNVCVVFRAEICIGHHRLFDNFHKAMKPPVPMVNKRRRKDKVPLI